MRQAAGAILEIAGQLRLVRFCQSPDEILLLTRHHAPGRMSALRTVERGWIRGRLPLILAPANVRRSQHRLLLGPLFFGGGLGEGAAAPGRVGALAFALLI